MNAAGLCDRLSGGDRRSLGRADEVAADVRAQPALFGTVFELMFVEDEVVRMRAADVVEKVTVRAPELLLPFQAEFLARLPEIRQQEVRWHAALILPRFPLTREERDAVVLPVLRGYLKDKSRIVQTFALQALADFAVDDARLRPEVIRLLKRAIETGSAAVKSRARRLLTRLGAGVEPTAADGESAAPRRRGAQRR